MNQYKPVKEFLAGKLKVRIYPDRNTMGKAVASDVALKMMEIIALKDNLRMIFAAAPSQNEFLAALCNYNLDWGKVDGFHMDEYVGINEDAPQGFGNFLKKAIFGLKPFKSVNLIHPNATDPEAECLRYSALINQKPVDICAMGIGENGHLAFNDPPVADFNDQLTVKTVELDQLCRQQQVNDGCFPHISEVPKHAYTLTIPTLLGCSNLFVTVPGISKADAVYKTLNNLVGETCPSTILRNYNAILYLDKDSA
jgi:glucosamine-6-phosphate deaminase